MLDDLYKYMVDGREYFVVDHEDCDVTVIDAHEMKAAYVGAKGVWDENNAPDSDNGYYECSICGQEFLSEATSRTGRKVVIPCLHMKVAFEHFRDGAE